MTERNKGIITSEPVKGACFAEDLTDHLSVLVPLREVANSRYLHTNDIITFDLVENPQRLGKFIAVIVRYASHNVSRQISGENAARS